MRRKRIIRYFAVALVSIVIIVSIRACVDFNNRLPTIFGCLDVNWSVITLLDSTDFERDTLSQVTHVTAYISAIAVFGHEKVRMKYLPIVQAYAATGSFLTYESYDAQVEPVTETAMQHIIKFDVPHEGKWILHVDFAYESLVENCVAATTYEIVVPK